MVEEAGELFQGPLVKNSLCLVGSLIWSDLINFLLLMVEEAGEVFQGPLVKDSLCLVGSLY